MTSVPSFGRVLGGRIFRITKVGLDDLQAIASLSALRPHIKTLTFGNARFKDPKEIFDGHSVATVCRHLPDSHEDRLLSAYTEAYRWGSSSNEAEHVQLLTKVLGSFQNLCVLRYRSADRPGIWNHLGGWLSPGDAEVLSRALEAETHGSAPFELSMYEVVMSCRSSHLFTSVFTAIKSAGSHIQELRISYGYAVWRMHLYRAQETYGILSNARKLQLSLEQEHLWWQPNTCKRIFDLLASVTHLWLSLAMSFESDPLPVDFTLMETTTRLLKLLKPLIHLESLCIQGPRCYHEDDLIELIGAHEDRLKLLAFSGPSIANGS
jgi:hypothetical protein